MSTSLASLQQQMAASIANGDGDILSAINQPPRGTAGQAFAVYQSAYKLRLTEFLRNDYPLLHRYVGESSFKEIAEAYIAAHPSHTPNARWYSQRLPQFLQDWASQGVWQELAMLEEALASAFDAPDFPVLTLQDLADIPQDQAAALRLCFHPSVRLMEFHWNVTSLWSALKADMEPPPPDRLANAQQVMVWRQGTASRFRILGDEEWMVLQAAAQGATFANLCELVAFNKDDGDAALRAASYLRNWFESDVLTETAFGDAEK
jgi:hypothetical protein